MRLRSDEVDEDEFVIGLPGEVFPDVAAVHQPGV